MSVKTLFQSQSVKGFVCVFSDVADDSTEDSDVERTCDSLLMCIVTVLSHGLRSGGGVGDVLRKPSKEVCATLISPRCTMCAFVCSCYAGSCELALSTLCFEPFSSFTDSGVSQCFHTAVQPPPCNSITLQNRFPQNSDSTANDVKEDVTICHTHGQGEMGFCDTSQSCVITWRADWLLKFMLTPK